MTKANILKIAGVVGVAIGSVCLFLSGAGQDVTLAIVGAVFALAAIIASLFKGV